MSARLHSAARVFARLLAEVLALLFAGLLFGVLFLLFTESGAQLALRQIEARTGLVHSSGVSGALWGPLSAEQLRYEDGFVAVELQQVTLDWSLLQLLAGRLGVSQLHASAVDLTLKPREAEPEPSPGPALTSLPVGIVARELRVGRLDIRGAGSPLHFERLALDAAWIDDVVAVETLRGQTPWVDAVALRGKVQLQPDGLRLDQVAIEGFMTAQLDGRYAYDADSDLTLQWTALRWPPAPTAEAALVESPRGQLRWQGRPEAWRYDAGAQLQFDARNYDLALQGSGTLDGMQAEQASIETGHGRVDLTAQLAWAEQFTAEAQARLEGIEPQFWVPQVEGELNGRLDASMRMQDGEPNLQARLALDRSTLQGRPATLTAQASYVGAQFDLAALDLRSGGTQLQARGKAWPQIALDLKLDSSDLRAALPTLEGRAKAHVSLEGRWPQLRARGNLQGGDFKYGSYTAETIAADFDVASEGESRADVLLGAMNVGQIVDSAQLRLRGMAKAHELSASASTPQGGLAVTLNGAADLDARNWAGEITAVRVSPRNLPAWSLEEAAALELSAQKIELAPVCLASDLARFCAGLRPVPGARRIALRLEQFKLPGLQPWLPAGTALSGVVDGQGYVDLGDAGLKDLRLDLSTTAIELSRSGVTPFKLLPGYVKVEADGQALRVVASLPFDVDGRAAGGLSLDAKLGPGADLMQRSLSGQWRVDMPDLSWLELLNREMQKVSGRLNGQLELGGTLAKPDLSGSVTLSDGGMSLRAPGITVEKMSASLQGRAGAILTLKAEAWSDDGFMRLEGTIDTEGGANAVELNLFGERFLAIRIPEASVWISPNLKVSFADKALRVGGSLEVPRADLTPKSIDQGVGVSADQVIVRNEVEPEEPGPAIYADIRVLLIGDPGMRIDGLGLKSKLGGEIRIIEEPGVVTRARGELQLKDGRYKAYGQDLTITTGRLLFNGGPVAQPAVELRATRQPREDITVGVLVRGTLDKPDFSLFSTPTMPQERQLSWLVLGRPLDETAGSAERGRVADAAVSLGLAGGEWLAQRYGGKIGIDEIGIGARPGESTDLAQLTIGKYLSPKLFISYGVRLFQPGQSFRMQYDLGRGFKLASETGVESGGDLLYTIEK